MHFGQTHIDKLTSGSAVPLREVMVLAPDVTKRVNFDFRYNNINFGWNLNNSTYREDANATFIFETTKSKTGFDPK